MKELTATEADNEKYMVEAVLTSGRNLVASNSS